MFKKATVVMLLINEKAKLILRNNTLCSNYAQRDTDSFSSHQHLYIVSDEEIKEGDAYYNIIRNEIQICENYIEVSSLKHAPEHAKKVIATTDTSLKIVEGDILPNGSIGTVSRYPEPSQSFIDKYITEYNKGDMITDVMVEYQDFDINYLIESRTGKTSQTLTEPKVNPKDNTVTIKRVKDSWTREEVELLCKNAYIEGFASSEDGWNGAYADGDNPNVEELIKYQIIEWIKNNLYS